MGSFDKTLKSIKNSINLVDYKESNTQKKKKTPPIIKNCDLYYTESLWAKQSLKFFFCKSN
jgi:hypothetical protein